MIKQNASTPLRSLRTCLITAPLGPSGRVSLAKLVEIFTVFSSTILVVAGERIIEDSRIAELDDLAVVPSEHRVISVRTMTSYALLQGKVALRVFSLRRNFDIGIFLLGGPQMVLPVLMARVLRKRAVVFYTGMGSHLLQVAHETDAAYGSLNKLGVRLLRASEMLTRILANKVAVESPSVARKFGFDERDTKLRFATLYVETDKFVSTKPPRLRRYLVGYIGGLEVTKNADKIISALPYLKKALGSLACLVVGTGSERTRLLLEAHRLGVESDITFRDWIDHDQVPELLGDVTFLVLPSKSEGLPNIVLEAMSSGAIVVATSAGGIPDVVEDGKTGVLLKSIDAESIAIVLLESFATLSLDQVANESRRLIQRRYSLKSAVESWKSLLTS